MATAEGRKVRMPGRKARLSHFSTCDRVIRLMSMRDTERMLQALLSQASPFACQVFAELHTGLESGIALKEVTEELPSLSLWFAVLAVLSPPCLTL